MATEQAFYERPLQADVAGGTAVRTLPDLPYSAAGPDGPRLDLYLPHAAPPPDGFPLLIFLHGGPLTPGGPGATPKTWRVFGDYGRAAASLGLAAAVLNHRYFGYAALPDAAADVLTAVRWLPDHAGQYHLDAGRLALWAFSGAGMLLRPFLQPGLAPGLRALVAFYPMLDLTHVPQALAAFREDELIALSPLAAVETMRPLPLFIARAGLDLPGLNRAVDTFVQQALYHNKPLELHNVPAGGHGFDFQEDIPGGRAVVAHAFRFVKTHVT